MSRREKGSEQVNPSPTPHLTKAHLTRILIKSSGVCGARPYGESLGLGFLQPSTAPSPTQSQQRYFGHFWRAGGSSCGTRSFTQVVQARSAPVVMVQVRADRGWGRQGFSVGRAGRGSGRGHHFTWQRDQELRLYWERKGWVGSRSI